jgi:WD40 repeat protein
MDGCVKRWRFDEPEGFALPEAGETNPKKINSAHRLEEMAAWRDFTGWVQAFSMHPSRADAVAADSFGNLRCADVLGEKPTLRWTVDASHDGWVRALAYTADGTKLLSAGRDGRLRVWDAETGKPLGECPLGEDLYAIAVRADGSQVAVADARARVHLIDAAKLERSNSFPVEEMYILSRMQEVGGIRSIRFTKDGQHVLASGSKPTSGGFVEALPRIIPISVADGSLGESWKISTGKDGFVLDMQSHPSGAELIAVSGQPGTGRIALFAPNATEPSDSNTTPPNCQTLAIHPSGKYVIVAATSRGGGNGKSLSPDGRYLRNTSPLHLFGLRS